MNQYPAANYRLAPHLQLLTNRHAMPGFMLIELMFALSILATFALLATMLCVATLRIPHEAGEKQEAILRFTSAVETLRQDVWEARAMSCPDDHTLILTPGTGEPITWNVIDAGLRRISADKTAIRSWNVPGKMAFSSAGPTTSLTTEDDPHHADRIEMASQLMLIAEARK